MRGRFRAALNRGALGMQHPTGAIAPGMAITIFSSNQFQGGDGPLGTGCSCRTRGGNHRYAHVVALLAWPVRPVPVLRFVPIETKSLAVQVAMPTSGSHTRIWFA
jgi:hypothetical protein